MGSGGRNATEGVPYSAKEAAKHAGPQRCEEICPSVKCQQVPPGRRDVLRGGQFIAAKRKFN
jgi:hypothetical protein